MKFLYLLAAIVIATNAEEYEDPAFTSWYPVRHRRDVVFDSKTGDLTATSKVGNNGNVFGKLGSNDNGLYGKAGYQHNLYNGDRGRLDGSAYGSRVLGPYGDSSHVGGRLDWQDQHARAAVDVSRQIGGKTSMHAEGGGMWPTSKRSDFSLQGTYDQTFGRRPDYGVLGSWRYRLP